MKVISLYRFLGLAGAGHLFGIMKSIFPRGKVVKSTLMLPSMLPSRPVFSLKIDFR